MMYRQLPNLPLRSSRSSWVQGTVLPEPQEAQIHRTTTALRKPQERSRTLSSAPAHWRRSADFPTTAIPIAPTPDSFAAQEKEPPLLLLSVPISWDRLRRAVSPREDQAPSRHTCRRDITAGVPRTGCPSRHSDYADARMYRAHHRLPILRQEIARKLCPGTVGRAS